MRRIVAGLIVGIVFAAGPAAARDLFGAEVGYAAPLSATSTFAKGGPTIEVHWRHHNRGRSAFEVELGYSQNGLEGQIQDTISSYEALMRSKNQLAQMQGGPGNGYLVAEYGSLEIYRLDLNYLFFPLRNARVSPYVSFGGGLYNWRVPFRVRFYRTPFFGEQHAYDPIPNSSFYAGVLDFDVVNYTKHETAGGINIAGGVTARLTRSLELTGAARFHLVFTNGDGNREEGIDDQDYLNQMKFIMLKGGLNWRF